MIDIVIVARDSRVLCVVDVANNEPVSVDLMRTNGPAGCGRIAGIQTAEEYLRYISDN